MSGRTCPKCGGSNLRERRNGEGRVSYRCRDCERGGKEGAGRTVKRNVEKLGQLEEHHLRRQLREEQSRNAELITQLASAKDVSDLLIKAASTKVAPIKPRERSGKVGKLREATALLMASDWHVEQRVDPAAVDDRNRYDLTISQRRMERFFERGRHLVEHERQHYTVRDMVLDFGGDFITNYLRDENQQTNLLTPTRAIAYWKTHAKAGIKFFLEDPLLERISVKCVDGNHPRLTKKMQAANRAGMNLETLMYCQLAEEFADEPRVDFQIATGTQIYFDVYDHTVRSLHGDVVNYHGGVGGITIPLLRALGRWNTVRHADLTLVHHFHQLTSLPHMIVNGSLIGFDEFAMSIGAEFEPPQQAFHMLDSLRFRSTFIPMFVGERSDDRLTRASERVYREG